MVSVVRFWIRTVGLGVALVLLNGCGGMVDAESGEDLDGSNPEDGGTRGDGGTLADGGIRWDGGIPDPLPHGFSDLSPTVASGGRDDSEPGSRIAYISSETGSDATGVYYFWDGRQVVDADGNGFGNDPFNPSGAIQPFATHSTDHVRTRTKEGQRFADWELFRRGESYPSTGRYGSVGISKEQPAVLAAWGPVTEPRPRFSPGGENFRWQSNGKLMVGYAVIRSMDIDAHGAGSSQRSRGPGAMMVINEPNLPGSGEPDPVTWLWYEDVRVRGMSAGIVCQGWIHCNVNRSVVTDTWNAGSHNQGTFIGRGEPRLTVIDSIYYRNGFKEDPHRNADPRRTIFDRNFYIGGGIQMGIHLDGIISADGGSGGPQMRHGGTVEDSLIMEGYWFTGTGSNGRAASWLSKPAGPSTFSVHDNVQLVYVYNTPNQPGKHDGRTQPGNGFTVQGASFGGAFERNIISGQMLTDLGVRAGFGRSAVILKVESFLDTGRVPQDFRIRDNIAFNLAGFSLSGEAWNQSRGIEISNNVWTDRGAVGAVNLGRGVTADDIGSALTLANNRFYSDRENVFANMSMNNWMNTSGAQGSGNSLTGRSEANAAEGWTAPARTLKTYCEEVLGLEVRSPTGLPEFMQIATENRLGAWDERLTGRAVVNYIREGFALDPV